MRGLSRTLSFGRCKRKGNRSKCTTERLIEQAQQRLLPGQISYIPEENQALEGLGQVNVDLVRELARRGEPQKMATIDLDSTVIESWKQEAQPTYQVGGAISPCWHCGRR